MEIHENFAKLIRNFAKVNDFIFAKFREIQTNVVKISCFAKFLKCCFAATLTKRNEVFIYLGQAENEANEVTISTKIKIKAKQER